MVLRLLRKREEAQNARDLQRLSAKLIHAQEEERRSIARELHDEIGQVLTTIRVELTLAQNKLAAAGGLEHLLRDAQSITDGALHTVRDLSHLLHPALLDDLGLAAALEWYVQPFARRHDLDVRLRLDGMAGRLPAEIEIAAFRMVQEALTNVARHARATTCMRSAPGQGTHVDVDLPIAVPASPLDETPRRAVADSATPEIVGG